MGEFKLVSIKPSTKSGKKLMATFENKNNKRRSVTHFGATGYSDYTKSNDKEQRARYRSRHKGDNLTIISIFFCCWSGLLTKTKSKTSYTESPYKFNRSLILLHLQQ